jgi:capsular polysaccharide biosynthesis protein
LTSWQIDSLKLLGYEPNDCIRWDRSRVQVKKLIVPSLRRYWGYYDRTYKTYGPVVSPMACCWIRQRVLSNLSNNGSDKHSFSSNIFISRRKALSRKIINENEVIEALAPFGFVAYVLEDLTFSEEVRLFSQAKMVVAPQGSGLINMIFSEKLAVIELFCSHGTNSLFPNLSRGLCFQYGYLKSQPKKDSRQSLHADIIVDVSELQNLVASMH